jgi:hypothetical protein
MKILVSTTWGKEYDELCSIISPLNLEYCRSHGYEYNIHHCQFNSPSVYYNVDFNLVLGLMGNYDLIVTLDADVLIMDHRKEYEQVFDWSYEQQIADENLGPDCSPLNAGVMIWKCGEWSRRLIQNLLDNRKQAERDPRNWQQQIVEMVDRKDPLIQRMNVVDAHVMNSHCNPGYPPSYRPGDFAVHFYCTAYQDKIRLAKKLSREITR